MVHVICDVFGSVFNFTTTEELLGVGLLIKNDTEGSSHVDSLSFRVIVDVLSGISASVTIDVLELV